MRNCILGLVSVFSAAPPRFTTKQLYNFRVKIQQNAHVAFVPLGGYPFTQPVWRFSPELQTCGVDLYTCLVREPRALGGKV